MQACGATPTTSEEIGVNRALHGITVTESAQQFSDKAARPSAWLEILRSHAHNVCRPFFWIVCYPLPYLFARNVAHRTRIPTTKPRISAEPARNNKTTGIHRGLDQFRQNVPALDGVSGDQIIEIAFVLRSERFRDRTGIA